MNSIPIVFAINNDYVKQLSVAIISIIENSKSSFEFNILTTYISDENKKILSNLDTTINFIDMNKIIEGFDLEKFMSRRKDYKYISVETYFRFFIPDLFPQYEKVLYLDADILVLNDLEKLYDEDISDYYAGAVQDIWMEVHLQQEVKMFNEMPFDEYCLGKLKKKDTSYFNAGVLLLNLKKMRNDSIVDRLWRFTQDESPLHFQDQDALNAVFDGHVKFLDFKWNLLKDIERLRDCLNVHLKRMVKNSLDTPCLVHYIGHNKPWVYAPKYDYSYAFIEDWWSYYQLSPYYRTEDDGILNAILSSINPKYICDFDYLCLRFFNRNILRITRSERGTRLRIYIFFDLIRFNIGLKRKIRSI